jgi:hypothetical protein
MNSIRFETVNIMKNVASGILIVLLIMAVGCAGTGTVKNANPEEDSFVIGRVKDRVVFKAGEAVESAMDNYSYPEMKVDGFELLNVNSGKAYKIRMNTDGYFVQKIDPGEFVFQLNMGARGYQKSSRDKGTLRLKHCSVPHKNIVNIGTFAVISNKHKGMVPNAIWFGVQPDYGPESFSDPLAWFKSKNPVMCDAYEGRIVSSK